MTPARQTPERSPDAGRSPAWAIFVRFLAFGARAWGGPIVQIATLRQEYAGPGGWVTPQRFDRALAVYQALPGPEAHEMCVYLGTVRGGRLGGIAAGLGFMLPGLVLMLLLAWAYVRFGVHPAVAAALGLAAPAVAALVVRAAWTLGRRVLVDAPAQVIGAAALVCGLLGAPMLLVLACGGAAMATWRAAERFRPLLAGSVVCVLVVVWMWSAAWMQHRGIAPPGEIVPGQVAGPGVEDLARMGLRAGLLTFGGAYAALPFLRHDAVGAGGWMTEAQFLDGVALAGVLPAPLIIVGTFVGALGGGLVGALVVTACIFLPAFAFTLLGHEIFEAMVRRPVLHAGLDGVTAAAIGLIGAVACQLIVAALFPMREPRPVAMGVFIAALLVLWRVRGPWVNPTVIVGAGVIGAGCWWMGA